MPASFVDEQVQFVATVDVLQEDLAGVGLDGRPASGTTRRTAPSSTRPASPWPCSRAERSPSCGRAEVASGTPFSTWRGHREPVAAPRAVTCSTASSRQLPSAPNSKNLPTGTVSAAHRRQRHLLPDRRSPRAPRRPSARRKVRRGQCRPGGRPPPTQKAITAAERRAVGPRRTRSTASGSRSTPPCSHHSPPTRRRAQRHGERGRATPAAASGSSSASGRRHPSSG